MTAINIDHVLDTLKGDPDAIVRFHYSGIKGKPLYVLATRDESALSALLAKADQPDAAAPDDVSKVDND